MPGGLARVSQTRGTRLGYTAGLIWDQSTTRPVPLEIPNHLDHSQVPCSGRSTSPLHTQTLGHGDAMAETSRTRWQAGGGAPISHPGPLTDHRGTRARYPSPPLKAGWLGQSNVYLTKRRRDYATTTIHLRVHPGEIATPARTSDSIPQLKRGCHAPRSSTSSAAHTSTFR